MGFLQQRYDNATMRYREAVEDYRSNDHPDEAAGRLKAQIMTYRYRCKVMGWATLVGMAAAVLLILSLIFAAWDVLMPNSAVIVWGGTVMAILGFLLVIAAAVLVIVEGSVANRQVDTELDDLPDLAKLR